MIKAEQVQDNYHRFEVETSQGKKYHYTFSDVHFDNAKCDRELFKRHLDEQKAKGATMNCHGDFFCLMQGKYDPRSNKSALRVSNLSDNYIESVVDEAVDFMLPYAENILMFSLGNHETSVSSRIEFNILKFFVDKLNAKADTKIQLGAYAGYFCITYNSYGRKRVVNFGYSHGNWGGIISKGTQSVSRYGLIFPDADIFISGHTHDGWVMTQPRLTLNKFSNKVDIKNQLHIKTGTYKEEFGSGKGWAVERIAMPKHIGGAEIEINVTRDDISYTAKLI